MKVSLRRTSGVDYVAYQLWQLLFDFYRGYGCSLDNMHNILIDLSNCNEASLHDGDLTIVFGCCKEGETRWWDTREFPSGLPVQMLASSGYDYFLKLSIVGNDVHWDDITNKTKAIL